MMKLFHLIVLSLLNTFRLSKEKQWVNPTLKNEYKLKRFKTYAAYSKVKPFWIYITVNFFKTFGQMKIFFKAYLEHNNGAWVLVK